METIKFSVRAEDDFLLYTLLETDELQDASSQAARAADLLAESRPYSPLVAPPFSPQEMVSAAEQGAVGTEAVGGLLPSVWALLFQRQEHLLDPVLPWLRHELAAIFGAQWWLAKRAESTVLHCLCACGPDWEVMVQTLQDSLEEYTAQLVHGIINVIVEQCSEEAQRLLQPLAVGDEDDSAVAGSSSTSSSSTSSISSTSSSSTTSYSTCQELTPDSSLASSSSPAGSHMDEEADILEAALCKCPGRPPSAPVPAEQEQPQEEPRQAQLVAGPSAQGSRRSPSDPVRDREDHLPRGPRRPPKRRATDPQDSPQPCKR